jgi:hypothetical protein
MLDFLIWRLGPISVASRNYLNRQLLYQGVPDGRLSRACVQDLADLGVDHAKVTAAIRRLKWHAIATDCLDVVAWTVWRLLRHSDDVPKGAIADKCREILADHGALP